jgi:hypothetical protein
MSVRQQPGPMQPQQPFGAFPCPVKWDPIPGSTCRLQLESAAVIAKFVGIADGRLDFKSAPGGTFLIIITSGWLEEVNMQLGTLVRCPPHGTFASLISFFLLGRLSAPLPAPPAVNHVLEIFTTAGAFQKGCTGWRPSFSPITVAVASHMFCDWTSFDKALSKSSPSGFEFGERTGNIIKPLASAWKTADLLKVSPPLAYKTTMGHFIII